MDTVTSGDTRALLSKVATSCGFFPAATRIQATVYLREMAIFQPEPSSDDKDRDPDNASEFHVFPPMG